MTKRILIPTDVPFWHRSTGAEQRIDALVRFLVSQQAVVRVFYLGDLAKIDAPMDQVGYELQIASSSQPPKQLAKRLAWYGAASLNQLKEWVGQNADANATQNSTQPMRLADFRWPWAIQQFGEAVAEFKPDSILIEYIKLAYLLEALSPSQRDRVTCAIDTHDVLHSRHRQFAERGLSHWLSVTKDEEAAALKPFDAILAIQSDEAQQFQQMLGDAHVIVVGHSFEGAADVLPPSTREKPVIGYIGSRNDSNVCAIREFLESVWSNVAKEDLDLRMLVAGKVCEALEHGQIKTDMTNVDCLGFVQDPRAFYEQVDLVVNPVSFGTGLKIKNLEAIAYGRGSVSTLNGLVGLPDALRPAVLGVECLPQMVELILDLSKDTNGVEALGNVAANLTRTELSAASVYSELQSLLLR